MSAGKDPRALSDHLSLQQYYFHAFSVNEPGAQIIISIAT
jgi:hypothetical protein